MGEIGRIYIDTNVFIATFERRESLGEKLTRLFSLGALVSPSRFVTSELTLAELLVHPLRNGDTSLADFYRELLLSTDWLSVFPVARNVLETAAALRSGSPAIKLPDAIHVATAIEAGCSHIISNDAGIRPVLTGNTSVQALLSVDEATIASLIESLAE